MKTPKKFLTLAIILGAIICFSVALSATYPSGTWRYKITVNVDTPEGMKTGSAVREVTFTPSISLMPDATPKPRSKGEAVVVDMGKRGVLFAITDYNDYQRVFRAFPFPRGGTTPEGLKYYSSLKDAKKLLKGDQFVNFRDIKDPLTVRAVVSKKTPELQHLYGDDLTDFHEAFGEDVNLLDVIIQMTEEPVTLGIVDKYLLWLPERKKGALDGRMGQFTNDMSSKLDYGNFKDVPY